MPSPRRLEFDEDGLSGRDFVIVVECELNGMGDSQKADKDRDDRFHVVGWVRSIIYFYYRCYERSNERKYVYRECLIYRSFSGVHGAVLYVHSILAVAHSLDEDKEKKSRIARGPYKFSMFHYYCSTIF